MSSTNLSGLGAIARPDGGKQVTYNDWPLYTFEGDKAPGETAGEGVLGQWFVATPALSTIVTVPSASAPAPATTVAPPAPTVSAKPPAPMATANPNACIPGNNGGDQDGDNNGSASDGDGCR